MSDAMRAVQAAVVTVLEADTALDVYDGPPPRAVFPYAAFADSIVADWSTKDARGREVRLALTVWDDGEEPSRLSDLMARVEAAAAGLPRDLPGWRVASNVFLRSMVVRDPAGPWAGLVEFRIRVLEV